MANRTLLALTAAALLTITGCANSTTGSPEPTGQNTKQPPNSAAPPSGAEQATASPEQPCDALSKEEVAAAYSVDNVTSKPGPTRGGAGVQLYSCQYTYNNVIVAVLQTGTLPGVDSATLLSQVKQGMAQSGADTTSESVNGVGDVAVFMPKFDQGKESMLSIKESGSGDFVMGSMTVAHKDGVDAKNALAQMTGTVMDRF